MKTWIAIGILVIGSASCSPTPPPVLPYGVEECEGSCLVLAHFDCPEKDTSKEVCTSKCKHIASLGYVWPDATSGPACIVKAVSLSEVRTCNVECKQ